MTAQQSSRVSRAGPRSLGAGPLQSRGSVSERRRRWQLRGAPRAGRRLCRDSWGDAGSTPVPHPTLPPRGSAFTQPGADTGALAKGVTVKMVTVHCPPVSRCPAAQRLGGLPWFEFGSSGGFPWQGV